MWTRTDAARGVQPSDKGRTSPAQARSAVRTLRAPWGNPKRGNSLRQYSRLRSDNGIATGIWAGTTADPSSPTSRHLPNSRNPGRRSVNRLGHGSLVLISAVACAIVPRWHERFRLAIPRFCSDTLNCARRHIPTGGRSKQNGRAHCGIRSPAGDHRRDQG